MNATHLRNMFMPKTGRRDDWEKTRWIVRSLDLTVALSEMTRGGRRVGLLYFEVRRADTFISGVDWMIARVIIGLRMADCAKAAASRRTPNKSSRRWRRA